MMEPLLAQRKAIKEKMNLDQENIIAKRDNLQERIEAKMDANKEKIDS
jgi:hypothetical protein